MNYNRFIHFSGMVLLTVALVACSYTFRKSYARFYGGPSRSVKEVALLVLDSDCYLNLVKQDSNEMRLSSMKGGELLPGRYQLAIGYVSSGYNKTYVSNGSTSITIDAQAGHTYFIYATQPGYKSWQPNVIELADEKDFSKIEYPEDRDRVKRIVAEYLSGDRRVIEPSTVTPGTWE